jgi:hypothetical protein
LREIHSIEFGEITFALGILCHFCI